MTATAFNRLRREWYQRAGVSEDIEREGKGGTLLLNEFGARSADATDLILAAEMGDAARAILHHPAMSRRHRAVWSRHCVGKTYNEIAAECRCSFREVSSTIDHAQALMLRPNWELHMTRPPTKKKRATEPAPSAEAFADVEATLEMGIKIAHRKIAELYTKPILESDDMADNERAVHTLLAVRRSELDYLKRNVPPYPSASDDDVRAELDKAGGRAP